MLFDQKANLHRICTVAMGDLPSPHENTIVSHANKLKTMLYDDRCRSHAQQTILFCRWRNTMGRCNNGNILGEKCRTQRRFSLHLSQQLTMTTTHQPSDHFSMHSFLTWSRRINQYVFERIWTDDYNSIYLVTRSCFLWILSGEAEILSDVSIIESQSWSNIMITGISTKNAEFWVVAWWVYGILDGSYRWIEIEPWY